MQLIVISHPETIENESDIINSLFNEGLELFHLRKPTYSEQELIGFLKKIKSKYYSRIVLHQHYSIAQNFGINRIHFSEKNRIAATEKELKKWKEKKYTLSTSVHSISDYELLSANFSYTFLGPVFESISKQDYKPESAKMIQVKENKNRTIKIIAIGGITANTIEKIKLANFDGAAILGAIWSNTSNAIEVLKNVSRT